MQMKDERRTAEYKTPPPSQYSVSVEKTLSYWNKSLQQLLVHRLSIIIKNIQHLLNKQCLSITEKNIYGEYEGKY